MSRVCNSVIIVVNQRCNHLTPANVMSLFGVFNCPLDLYAKLFICLDVLSSYYTSPLAAGTNY